MEKRKHLFFVATNVLLRCTMQVHDCTPPHSSPELSLRALLTSNRKENHKNIQCTFSHVVSTCSTVCGYLGTVHVLNDPLSVIKRPILRLDISPPPAVEIHRQFPCFCMQQAAVRRIRQYYTTRRRIDYHLPHRDTCKEQTNRKKWAQHFLPLYVHFTHIIIFTFQGIKNQGNIFFFDNTKQSSFRMKVLFTQIYLTIVKMY